MSPLSLALLLGLASPLLTLEAEQLQNIDSVVIESCGG